MHEAGHSKSVLLDNQEGWGRAEGGRSIQDGGDKCIDKWGNNGNSDRLYLGGLQNHCTW